MNLKLRKITVVLTAALTLGAAAIPTKAEAFGFLAPALIGAALMGSGGPGSDFRGDGRPWGGYAERGYDDGGYDYGGYGRGDCCRQDWAPPPPPRCCYYNGWDRGRGGWRGDGYGGW